MQVTKLQGQQADRPCCGLQLPKHALAMQLAVALRCQSAGCHKCRPQHRAGVCLNDAMQGDANMPVRCAVAAAMQLNLVHCSLAHCSSVRQCKGVWQLFGSMVCCACCCRCRRRRCCCCCGVSTAAAPAHAVLGAGSGSVVLPAPHAWQNDFIRAPPGEMLPGRHCLQAAKSTLLPLASLPGTVV
jgi:hypothetical protein